jgi:hypothetical protein
MWIKVIRNSLVLWALAVDLAMDILKLALSKSSKEHELADS